MESIGYVLVYFLKGILPWQGIVVNRVEDRYRLIYEKKKNTTPEELCNGLPIEFSIYLTYAKNLPFEQEPDYAYLRGLFNKLMIKKGYQYDNVFDWTKPKEPPKDLNLSNASIEKKQHNYLERQLKKNKKKKEKIEENNFETNASIDQVVNTEMNQMNILNTEENKNGEEENIQDLNEIKIEENKITNIRVNTEENQAKAKREELKINKLNKSLEVTKNIMNQSAEITQNVMNQSAEKNQNYKNFNSKMKKPPQLKTQNNSFVSVGDINKLQKINQKLMDINQQKKKKKQQKEDEKCLIF